MINYKKILLLLFLLLFSCDEEKKTEETNICVKWIPYNDNGARSYDCYSDVSQDNCSYIYDGELAYYGSAESCQDYCWTKPNSTAYACYCHTTERPIEPDPIEEGMSTAEQEAWQEEYDLYLYELAEYLVGVNCTGWTND